MPIKGFDQRAWCAELFHELVQERAWEKAVRLCRKGCRMHPLQKHCALYVPFLRRLVLHDVWLAHRHGQCRNVLCWHFLLIFVANRSHSQTAQFNWPDNAPSGGTHWDHGRRRPASPLQVFPVGAKAGQQLPCEPPPLPEAAHGTRATGPLSRKVAPGKKRVKRHTQHVCCELRRWRTRKKDGSGRVREASCVSKRARVRDARLRKVRLLQKTLMLLLPRCFSLPSPAKRHTGVNSGAVLPSSRGAL